MTFEEWDACVDDGGCNGYRPQDQGWGGGRHPVISVNWDDANAYASWLSRKTGKPYRLLSEAEWEYVARSGTKTRFWWGDTLSTDEANFHGENVYPSESKGEFRRKALPVASFRPNPWGFYQVHGNTYDWVADCYHDNYFGAPSDGSAWTSGNCDRRVVRGGAWTSAPWLLRASYRGNFRPAQRIINLGFRLARTLTP